MKQFNLITKGETPENYRFSGVSSCLPLLIVGNISVKPAANAVCYYISNNIGYDRYKYREYVIQFNHPLS